MVKYTVKIYPQAIHELNDIYEYIANDKQSPENGKIQADRIKEAILSLSTFPESHQNRLHGRYAGEEYKQLLVDNYVVIFKIDKEQRIVYVVTIQYQGRNI